MQTECCKSIKEFGIAKTQQKQKVVEEYYISIGFILKKIVLSLDKQQYLEMFITWFEPFIA